MRMFSNLKGWMSGLLVVAMVMATFAPAAEAGRRGKGRYKNSGYCETRVVRQVYVPRRVRYVEPHVHYSSYRIVRSDAGPVIAGFIGGLFLGATLANAAPAGYEYYDPYCGATYGSLRAYNAHLSGGCGHAAVVQVRECGGSYDRDHYTSYRDDRYDDHRYEGGYER